MTGEAKSELDLALLVGAVLQERGYLKEGEMVGDFVVMAEITNWTYEGSGKTKYCNIIPGQNGIPMHRVLGLIEVCGDLLRTDDDDE